MKLGTGEGHYTQHSAILKRLERINEGAAITRSTSPEKNGWKKKQGISRVDQLLPGRIGSERPDQTRSERFEKLLTRTNP